MQGMRPRIAAKFALSTNLLAGEPVPENWKLTQPHGAGKMSFQLRYTTFLASDKSFVLVTLFGSIKRSFTFSRYIHRASFMFHNVATYSDPLRQYPSFNPSVEKCLFSTL